MLFNLCKNQIKKQEAILLLRSLEKNNCYRWRAPRAMSGGLFTPRCVPLRALSRGYDYVARRAMSLRDGSYCLIKACYLLTKTCGQNKWHSLGEAKLKRICPHSSFHRT